MTFRPGNSFLQRSPFSSDMALKKERPRLSATPNRPVERPVTGPESSAPLTDPAREIDVFLYSEDRPSIEAICRMLERRSGIHVVGSANDVESVRRAVSELPIDVMLIGVNQDELRLLNFVQEIQEERTSARVIVFGLEEDDVRILRFVQAGALGYVCRGESFDDLVGKIEAVWQGRFPSSPRINASVAQRLSRLSQGLRNHQQNGQPRLTAREREVLELIASGMSNKDIAQRLDIALYTVKNHVHNLFGKLSVNRRREAVQRGYEHGLLRKSFRS